MLLAPLLPMSLSSAPRACTHQRLSPIRVVDSVQLTSQRRWLLGLWILLGSLAVLCIPSLRGGIVSGWTLPFWLIAAPAINLCAMAWVRRREQQFRR